MDVDAARKIIAETETDRSIKNCFARGMGILLAHCEPDEELYASFRHDQILTGDFETLVKGMTELTVKRMAKMGWFEDEDAWSYFS